MSDFTGLEPKVSIITPAYIDSPQKRDWLFEAIQSVQDQTFKDWELIIVDDNSPVSIDEIKQAYINDQNKIRFFKTTSQSGPALARNTGVALAESEAILPLDADDMLADSGVLSLLYDTWQANPKQVVYGDLQRLENGQRGKVFNLPEYSFQHVLDLNGVIPVTALHSIDCHIKAGGWKPELQAGLEDVEYWIAAGKAGFCGHRVQGATLLYRRHDSSRSFALRRTNRRESEMRNKIISLHKDVFEGRYPMGCCGGGKSYIPPNGYQNQTVQMATTLNQFPSSEKQWVEYTGKRSASFDVVGEFTGVHYAVHGPGHKLEVHNNDLPKFRRSGRGKDFGIGVAPPADQQPEEGELIEEFIAPEPQLTEIERLDSVAARSRGFEPTPEPQISFEPEFVTSGPVQSTIPAGAFPAKNSVILEEVQPLQANANQALSQNYDLTPLDLGEKTQEMLSAESWSIQKLAGAGLNELTSYPGIGPKTAERIIQSAKDHLEQVK